MLPCTLLNEQIKLFEIVHCFNCEQILLLSSKQGKQDIAMNSRNCGRNIAAIHTPYSDFNRFPLKNGTVILGTTILLLYQANMAS